MTEHSLPEGTKALLNDLENTKDDYIRKIAAEQLGEQETSDEKIVVALRKIAESDPNKYVREAAYSSLMKLGVETVTGEENLQTIVTDNPKTNWALIGILAGLIPGLILLVLFPRGAHVLLFGIGSFIGIPFGLIGAYLGRRSNKTAWISAIVGTILGMGLSFWFAMATCLFCQ